MKLTATGITYRCLQCDSPLAKIHDKVVCKQCGFERQIKDKVIVFETAPYWGEFSQQELQQMIADTKKSHWQREVEHRFNDVDSQRYRSVADLNRASWIDLLPLDADSQVLDIGSGLGAITHALALNFRQVVSLEPVLERAIFTSLRVQQERLDHVEVISANILDMPFFDNSFDLIVMNGILEWIGEWDLHHRPDQAQLHVLTKVHRLLKPGGILLIGIENRIGLAFLLGSPDHYGIAYTSLLPRPWATFYLKKKAAGFYRTALNPKKEYRTYTYTLRGYRQLLLKAGFEKTAFYLPYPNYNSPLEIIPLATNTIFAACYFNRVTYRSHWLKRVVRWLALKTGLWRHLASHFLIMAPKQQVSVKSVPLQKSPSLNIPEFIASKLQMRVDEILFYLRTHSRLNRHTLVVIDRHRAKSLAVARIANVNRDQFERLTEESVNLKWLQDIARNDENLKSSFPTFLAFDKIDNNLLLLQRYVAGTSLYSMLRPSRVISHGDRMLPLFERAMQWLINFHSLSRDNCDRFHGKQNSLTVATPEQAAQFVPLANGLSDLLKSNQSLRQTNFPQHGDFSPINIFMQANRVGVIDWEDLKTGYPPLFDVFCLFTPLMRLDNADSMASCRALFDSLYFSSNLFSAFIYDQTMSYCHYFGIDRELIPLHFFDFLWIKYRRFTEKKNVRLANLFVEFMGHFEKNRNRFIVNIYH
jgi:SAM-dependent methyltransferase/DNA-directed RNA polymerase subunit RPC12/RpoP